ncbi:MAG: sigma-70 family RNA polymerase sigma factor [Ignavibacteriae bacterium]|nr:sigma-70 family RNA polymerase sigma factor [Ignavibacteriota bacterium]MCB0724075.1 sigma-70 family RNA polymerase sigma factor [Ignavibacteriota bacterium]MCB9243881.1 sigma-70 family RNA polymerase sigma factor [Ignavibacteriales bacterium]
MPPADLDYKALTDEELIFEFQKEDVEAFNEIVFRYKDKLVNFLFRYTGNRDEAEDLAQDTFLKLYRSKHLYKEIAKFSTWFYTIAINIAKTNLRKKSRQKAISISDFDPENEKDFDLPADVISPEDSANASIENYYIQKAINSLGEKFKEVIVLRDIQDMEYEEIAQITGLPLGTVKSRINRGRERLKELLSDIYKPGE